MCGLFLQLVFALIVLRSSWGYGAFEWLANRVTEYLDHANFGAQFIFGKDFRDHAFAFQVIILYAMPLHLLHLKKCVLNRDVILTLRFYHI